MLQSRRAMSARHLFKPLALTVAGVTGAALAAGLIYAHRVGAPRYDGPPSPNFDGERFVNLEPLEPHRLSDFIRWISNREPGFWPDRREVPPGPPPPQRIEGDRLRVTWVNHATVLLQTEGLNILTDPIWSERCSPVSWAGPIRRRPPGIRFDDLPPIDVVVISHNHYDHMDVPTLRMLAERDQPQIFVALGNQALLAREGIGSIELDWWQSVPLTGRVRLHAVPVQHFSSRSINDRNRTLWTGWVVQAPGGNSFFAGDSGWGPHFQQIADRFAPLRLAILPIGAFRPRWFMAPVHIDPEAAVEAHRLLQARTSIPMHYGTFPLGDDGEQEAAEVLQAAITEQGIDDGSFWIIPEGEGRDVP
jgi:L-ascorbate metabolism protein UlaG (beta-lactamase superfamily)